MQNVSHGPYLCPKHTRCHSCGSTVSGNGLSTRYWFFYLISKIKISQMFHLLILSKLQIIIMLSWGGWLMWLNHIDECQLTWNLLLIFSPMWLCSNITKWLVLKMVLRLHLLWCLWKIVCERKLLSCLFKGKHAVKL